MQLGCRKEIGEDEFSNSLIRKGNCLRAIRFVKNCTMYKVIPHSLTYQIPDNYWYLENLTKLVKK